MTYCLCLLLLLLLIAGLMLEFEVRRCGCFWKEEDGKKWWIYGVQQQYQS